MICKKCGAEVGEDVKFCTVCGEAMQEAEKVVAEPVETTETEQTVNPELSVYDKVNVNAIILLILSILCQCNIISAILAIVSLVKSNAAKNAYHAGDLAQADAAFNAKKKCNMWGWIIFGAAIVIGLLAIFVFPTVLVAFLATLGFAAEIPLA